MATVEGRGHVKPAPKTVTMTGDELEILRAEGRMRANFRGYGKRNDAWGKGFMKTPTDPIFHGNVGESAFAKWMNHQLGAELFKPDLQLKPGGDGGKDFDVCGMRIDVKANLLPADSSFNLLVRRVDNGRIIPLVSDIFVFVSTEKPTAPALLGWARREDMERFAKSPRQNATHWNIEIPRDALKPMNRLVALVKANRVEV